MLEIIGLLAAMLSSSIGGTAIGATRFLAADTDPLTIAGFRFGIGVVLLLPTCFLESRPWPARQDWARAVALGVLFFAVFPILFNASLIYTTAARGALALSTLPLLTMVTAALLSIESLTFRKLSGVLIAIAGVGVALVSSLDTAAPGAWKGDLLMLSAAVCMALYSTWSKAIIGRSGPIRFTTIAMASGFVVLVTIEALRGRFAHIGSFTLAQWTALAYLGVFGGAVTFFLWAFALGRTTPTLVAISVTMNPVTASFFGAYLLGERVSANLLAGIASVLIGITIAASGRPAGADRLQTKGREKMSGLKQ